jgi:hypothetical protein
LAVPLSAGGAQTSGLGGHRLCLLDEPSDQDHLRRMADGDLGHG